MTDDPKSRATKERRLRRVAVVGSAIGLLLGYSVLIPMRAIDNLPAHVGWATVVIFPPTAFGLIAGTVVIGTLYTKRSALWIMLLGIAVFVIWSATVFFD